MVYNCVYLENIIFSKILCIWIIIVCSTAAIDQLFDINIPVSPIEEYLQNSASTLCL